MENSTKVPTTYALAQWARAKAGYEAALVVEEELANAPDPQAYDDDYTLDLAYRALLDTLAPTVEALAYKLQVILQRGHCPLLADDASTPDTIGRLLSEKAYEGPRPLARVYQDALHLAGLRPDLVAAEAPASAAASMGRPASQ